MHRLERATPDGAGELACHRKASLRVPLSSSPGPRRKRFQQRNPPPVGCVAPGDGELPSPGDRLGQLEVDCPPLRQAMAKDPLPL